MLSSEHGVIAIVRTIIETHNGQIAVDNQNGSKGAACRVKLPMG
jgi:nitrogen fixation/metabolism regulation signal transduction histidine kinase